MPSYEFACDDCKVRWEVKMTFDEHTERKGKIKCPECKEFGYQVVVRPNFRMLGEGWFGSSSDAIEHPYAITQRELDANLDLENRVEDMANNFSEME